MSKIPNLSYKQILDEQGNFKALEIIQHGQRIVISLSDNAFGDGDGNYKWPTIKQTIDAIQARVTQQANMNLSMENN